MNCPKLCRQNKNPLLGRILKLSNELTSHFKGSQFCFKLDTFVIVKVDVFTYEEARLLIGGDFLTVNALSFKNGEKIFSQSVVIRISTS